MGKTTFRRAIETNLYCLLENESALNQMSYQTLTPDFMARDHLNGEREPSA